MKIVIDMNLSPTWVQVFDSAGWDAVHWSEIGDIRAPDHEILQWSKDNKHIVFTHDLDFGTILAATNADYPSVIQIRTQNVNPNYLSNLIIPVLIQFENRLEKGALITVDESKSRVRILPLNPS